MDCQLCFLYDFDSLFPRFPNQKCWFYPQKCWTPLKMGDLTIKKATINKSCETSSVCQELISQKECREQVL